jgi:hypothetical protein
VNDTSPEMQARYYEGLMSKTPEERLLMVGSMYECAKQLATAGILLHNPNLSPDELRAELFRRFYASDFSPERLEDIIAHLQQNAGEFSDQLNSTG